jgi:hypothetical protein
LKRPLLVDLHDDVKIEGREVESDFVINLSGDLCVDIISMPMGDKSHEGVSNFLENI